MVLLPSISRAQSSSGNWSGEVEARGNYYWETSTRVLAPEIRGRVTTPDGTDITGGYLVDAITSASIAAGVISDVRFTETRNQGTAGVGHEFDLGDAQLRLDLGARVSHEPDYLATSGSLGAQLFLADRATVFGASLGFIHDSVGSVLRGSTSAGSLHAANLLYSG